MANGHSEVHAANAYDEKRDNCVNDEPIHVTRACRDTVQVGRVYFDVSWEQALNTTAAGNRTGPIRAATSAGAKSIYPNPFFPGSRPVTVK